MLTVPHVTSDFDSFESAYRCENLFDPSYFSSHSFETFQKLLENILITWGNCWVLLLFLIRERERWCGENDLLKERVLVTTAKRRCI